MLQCYFVDFHKLRLYSCKQYFALRWNTDRLCYQRILIKEISPVHRNNSNYFVIHQRMHFHWVQHWKQLARHHYGTDFFRVFSDRMAKISLKYLYSKVISDQPWLQSLRWSHVKLSFFRRLFLHLSFKYKTKKDEWYKVGRID